MWRLELPRLCDVFSSVFVLVQMLAKHNYDAMDMDR